MGELLRMQPPFLVVERVVKSRGSYVIIIFRQNIGKWRGIYIAKGGNIESF